MTQPLAIDLFSGLGGWAEGLLAEGYDVVGFDNVRHVYGDHHYPAQLVIQDVLTLHGSQFKSASLIVASPPCQFFSYTAMPWTRAKALAAAVRADPVRLEKELALFTACFRIQREACEAAGRHIPLIVENVRGAIPWVGRSRFNYGSFHLWGDVPALMPITPARSVMKCGVAHRSDGSTNWHGLKGVPHPTAGHWTNPAEHEGVKQHGSDPTTPTRQGAQRGRKYDLPGDGLKQPGINLSVVGFNVANARQFASMVDGVKIVRSDDDKRQHIGTSRKFASAMIAKIPEPLSRHIAATFRPAIASERAAA